MRVIKAMLTSIGLTLAATVTAVAAPLAMLQDAQAPVKVDVRTSATHTVWYADPVWIAVGIGAVLLIIVLAVLASRGRDSGSNTTVIR